VLRIDFVSFLSIAEIEDVRRTVVRSQTAKASERQAASSLRLDHSQSAPSLFF